MLYQLAYVSDMTHALDKQQIEGILQLSRHNNQENNITGILVPVEEHFFQVLEGEQAQVTATLKRILSDKRHQNLRIIYQHGCKARDFADSSMGFDTGLYSDQYQDARKMLLEIAQRDTFNELHANSTHLLLKGMS